MSSSCDDRYVLLRKRLDQLGYRQSLGLESLPLVEKLFGDLIATTESLRNAKNAPHVPSTPTIVRSDDSAEYLRMEVERMTKVNAELQNRHIKANENCEKKLQEFRSSQRKLQHENEDLKFLNNQYMYRLRQTEKESENKLKKLLDYQERFSEAAVHTAHGRRKGHCRQRMEIGYPLNDDWVATNPPCGEGVDLMQIADTRIEQLTTENAQLTERGEQLQQENEYLDRQVKSRDLEIERLNQTMFGAGTGSHVFGGKMANDQLITQQTTQIEYLQQQNRELELRVDQLISAGRIEVDRLVQEREALVRRNEALESEVKAGRPMKKQESKTNRVEASLAEFEDRLRDQKEQINGLVQENREMAQNAQSFDNELIAEREKNSKLSNLLQKCHESKNLIANRLEQQIQRERQLMREMHDLKGRRGADTKGSPLLDGQFGDAAQSSLQADYARIRGERDELRALMGKLETRVLTIHSHVGSLKREKDEYRRLYELKLERDDAPHEVELLKEKLLEENSKERDRLLSEIRRLEGATKKVEIPFTSQGTEDDAQVARLDDRVIEMSLELESMTAKYDAVDRELCNLGIELQVQKEKNENLTLENDRLNDELATCLERCREEIGERHVLSKERDQIREEVSRQEQCVGELRVRLGAREDEIHMLQDDLIEARACLEKEASAGAALSSFREKMNQTICRMDEEHYKLSLDIDEKAEIIDELGHDLTSRKEELAQAGHAKSLLEDEITRLKRAVSAHEQEADLLRRNLEMSSCENERHVMANEATTCENERVVDELSALISHSKQLEYSGKKASDRVNQLERQLQSTKAEIDTMNESLYSKNEQLQAFREEQSKLAGQLEALKAEKTRMAEEIQKYRLSHVDYQNQIEAVLFDNKQNLRTINEQETELEALGRKLSQTDTKLADLMGENEILRRDLKNTADLAGKLSLGRDQLQSQLAFRDVSQSRMEEEMGEHVAEMEEMQSRLQNEAGKIRDLNEAMQTSRDKIYRQELTIQDKQGQIRTLEDKVALLQDRIETMARDLEVGRVSCVGMDADLQKLRKQLTSERFQKEKALQEARRLRPDPPP